MKDDELKYLALEIEAKTGWTRVCISLSNSMKESPLEQESIHKITRLLSRMKHLLTGL